MSKATPLQSAAGRDDCNWLDQVEVRFYPSTRLIYWN